jgi:ATP-dependent Clp protease adapter protein ClpS
MMADLSADTKQAIDVKFDKNWKVILFDDNTTSEMCVVYILTEVFKYTAIDAYKLMKFIEKDGSSVIAILPKKLAEKRIKRSKEIADDYGYKDLKMEMEEED